jgi:hypothetical protein
MPTNDTEGTEQEPLPPRRRAAIYLREPRQGERNPEGVVPSIDVQRLSCGYMADFTNVEIVGEFVDHVTGSPRWPGLRAAIVEVHREQLDYLIVSSWDRLATEYASAFRIALSLGSAMPISADAGAETASEEARTG